MNVQYPPFSLNHNHCISPEIAETSSKISDLTFPGTRKEHKVFSSGRLSQATSTITSSHLVLHITDRAACQKPKLSGRRGVSEKGGYGTLINS